jgi:hypothetical protein
MAQLRRLAGYPLLVLLAAPVLSQSTTAWNDSSPYITRFTDVDENVKLKVLDWVGSGRSLVLLARVGILATFLTSSRRNSLITSMFTALRGADSALPVIQPRRFRLTNSANRAR